MPSEQGAIEMNACKQSTPHALLIGQLLDSRIPKSEREHAAAREIERLTSRRLSEKQADDRAHRIATIAAEDFVRCNGLSTNTADEFVFHGADLADEHFQDCIAHLKWAGECVVFEGDEETIVRLGDFTLESLA